MNNHNKELIKNIKKQIDIFADVNCKNCDICEEKDCPLEQLLQGKINIYGNRVLAGYLESTMEVYDDNKLYEESD